MSQRIRLSRQLLSRPTPLPPRICAQCLSCQNKQPSHRQFSSSPARRAREDEDGEYNELEEDFGDEEGARIRDFGLSLEQYEMFKWLKGPGSVFKNPLPGSTNYLSAYNSETGVLHRLNKARTLRLKQEKGGDEGGADLEDPDDPDMAHLPLESKADSQMNTEGERPIPKEGPGDLRPFPLNKYFQSQPVLSEELRQEIWRRVKTQGDSVRTVSTALNVEMRRVAAVVRLVELEKEMIHEGKPLAKPYAKAVLAMLPKTEFTPGSRGPVMHESINDLPVHRMTHPQIFYPVSESRHFTRTDAGRVFSAAPRLIAPTKDGTNAFVQNTDPSILKPADERIPHPQLIIAHKDQTKTSPQQRLERYQEWMQEEEEAIKARKAREEARERREVKKVEGKRFEFRFRDVTVSRETVGMDGRGRTAVGRRYGVPNYDRKRGTVKIPTSVEA